MDKLFEHLYRYKKKPVDYIVQALIFITTLGIAMTAYFLFGMLLPKYGYISDFFGNFLGIMAIVGCVYVGYKIFMKFDIEYEYIYLSGSGEIDFDKIVSKTNRTRLITVKFESVESFGEYTPEFRESIKEQVFSKLFDFTSNTGAKRYYLICNHREFKRTVVIFKPTEEMLAEIEPDINRALRIASFRRS